MDKTEDNKGEESNLDTTAALSQKNDSRDTERHVEFVFDEMQVTRPRGPRPPRGGPRSARGGPRPARGGPRPARGAPRPGGVARQPPPGAVRPPSPGTIRQPPPGAVRPLSPDAIRQPPPGAVRPPSPGTIRPPPPSIIQPLSRGSLPVPPGKSKLNPACQSLSDEENIDDEQPEIEKYSFRARGYYLRKVFYGLFIHIAMFTALMTFIYNIPPVQEYILEQRIPLLLTSLFLAYIIATLVIFPDLTDDSPYKYISLGITTFILLCTVSFVIAFAPYREVLVAFTSTGLTCLLVVILTTQHTVKLKLIPLFCSVMLLNILIFAPVYVLNLYTTTVQTLILTCISTTFVGFYFTAEAYLVYNARHPYVTSLSSWTSTFFTIYLDPFNTIIAFFIYVVNALILRKVRDFEEEEEEELT